MTADLRILGVVPCDRCHGTGLSRNDDTLLGFCDCATGRAVWDAALTRAVTDVTDVTADLIAGPQA